MLISKTRWLVRETDEATSKALAEQLNVTPLVANLLINRGISGVEEAKEFLFVENEDFHDPYLMNDMDQGVARIKDAINNQESILVYGDYDADGVTSTSVLISALHDLGASASYYIPNRFTEGYGPNENAFREAAANGIKLIITVDTGISAVNEAKLAKELGIDLIITDHHEPGSELPPAFAIIHPNLPDTNYPFPHLAGVGVAFKLAHALYGETPWHLLDLATIGTIADLVPLHGENRLIVKSGLIKLASSARLGLHALCSVAGIKLDEVNEETVGFAIAPRLNAAGRLAHAGPAVELLMTNHSDEALLLAEKIDQLNKERQSIVSDITKEAISLVEAEFPPEDNGVLVVGKEGWHPGVIGIVASRLVERFYRPAIVLSFDHETGMAKGSARSIVGFDLFKNLSTCSDILPHFGGHPMAAGMTLSLAHVEELRLRLNIAAKNQLAPEDFIPVTELDASINLKEINIDSIGELDKLAPYGMKNPKPKILIENSHVSGVRQIGGNQAHLKMTLEDDGHALDGVGFNLGEIANEISSGSKVSVIGELAINEWNNSRKPQIFIKDVAITDWQLFDFRGNKQINRWLDQIPVENTIYLIFQAQSASILSQIGENAEFIFIDHDSKAADLKIDGKNIVLVDLPPSILFLEKLVHGKSPARVYAHFYHESGHFFSTLPTRDYFKWYYSFLLKRKSFDLRKQGAELATYRGWTKETIDFMSQVFFELEFVTIKDGIISVNTVKSKKDLAEAPTYQKKQAQITVENELLYSSFQDLKKWFDVRVQHSAQYEEEVKAWI